MSHMQLICGNCNCLFDKSIKEYNRQLRQNSNYKFYCSISCHRRSTAVTPEEVTKMCQCGNIFVTTTGATYCCRACASKFSFNENRKLNFLNSGTQFSYSISSIITIANGLRNREYYKYVDIEQYLINENLRFQFEFPLAWYDRVFDLCLLEYNVFIEFDERYHSHNTEDDLRKTNEAIAAGYTVYRINVVGLPVPFPGIILNDIISFVKQNHLKQF